MQHFFSGRLSSRLLYLLMQVHAASVCVLALPVVLGLCSLPSVMSIPIHLRQLTCKMNHVCAAVQGPSPLVLGSRSLQCQAAASPSLQTARVWARACPKLLLRQMQVRDPCLHTFLILVHMLPTVRGEMV